MGKYIEKILTDALTEDVPFGDLTTDTIIDTTTTKAYIVSNSEGIFCGKIILQSIPEVLPDITIQKLNVKDGKPFTHKQIIAILKGTANTILKIERTLLNFISLLSGIATTTNLFVNKLKRTGIILKDTRKTIPTLRVLQKYAVKVGGGKNHRMNLSEFAMIKDNHIKLLMKKGVKYLANKLKTLEKITNGNFEIEVQDLKIVDLIKKYNIYIKYIMLDNLSLCDLEEGIKSIRKYEQKKRKKIFIELSGGINLENIDEYKHFDVDYISVGAITKNVCSKDFSLEIA